MDNVTLNAGTPWTITAIDKLKELWNAEVAPETISHTLGRPEARGPRQGGRVEASPARRGARRQVNSGATGRTPRAKLPENGSGASEGDAREMGIIDHIGLAASDFDRSLAFYSIALKPLGITLIMQFPAGGPAGQAAAGFGVGGKPELWISPGGPVDAAHPYRAHRQFARRGRRLLRGCPRRRRDRQWCSGGARALPSELLWGLCARPGWA